MEKKESDRFADELLDAALARYSADAPPPGLEERLLARLRPKTTRAAWLRVAARPLAAAVAVLLLMVGLFLARRSPPPTPTQPTLARPATPPQPPAAPLQPTPAPLASAPAAPARVAVAPRSPRRPRFPSPAPLSRQERLLLRYATQAPEAVQWGRRAQPQPLASLQIHPLEISLLVVEQLRIEPLEGKNN